MRTKAILIAIAAIFAVGAAGVWFLISEKQAAQERREEFFGATKEFPTSGGKKLKPEW
ncbi:entry exclusion protein TrbK [Rhizobium sullae]|uniref:Ti type entry exclusion protein TrbK n=1 Tax=Rhizobium sullae TaxID=50338 RepID=A0A4R3PTZ2_RHISU|nr:entry exclusion protein TrbK [Rhizobium sullae]TCU08662.1 Ti type entry exclusion protein TrbK [Rhizobium sullae]